MSLESTFSSLRKGLTASQRASNVIFAFKFVRLLVTPWRNTKAYKMGLVDRRGNVIRKPSTSQEKLAYSVFNRLVFNIKRLLEKLPGGSTIGSYASALYLLKEFTGLEEDEILQCLHESGYDISPEGLRESSVLPEESSVFRLRHDLPFFADERLMEAPKGTRVEVLGGETSSTHFSRTFFPVWHPLTERKIYITTDDILPMNEAITSAAVTTKDVATPPTRMDKHKTYSVPSNVFRRFSVGRKKYQRWKKYLDLDDDYQREIADFAKKNRKTVIVLQDETTGAMMAIRPTASNGS